MMRTFGIWVSGLLASFLIGGFIGTLFRGPYDRLSCALAGMLVFTCARLWLAGKPKS